MAKWLPLGQRFRFEVDLSREEARRAVRAKLDKFPGKINEIWGFCPGSLFFLQEGLGGSPPSLLARMKEKEGGLVISGAAGVNLTGLFGFAALCLLFLGVAMLRWIVWGDWHGIALFSFAPLLLYAVAWANHAFCKDADRLVLNFKRMLGAENPPPVPRSTVAFPAHTAVPMQLDISGTRRIDAVEPEDVRKALLEIAQEEEGFVILAIEDEHYMQTVWEGDGFTLERREGSEDTHFVALRVGETQVANGTGSSLTLAEVEQAFSAYCAQTQLPDNLEWRPRFGVFRM